MEEEKENLENNCLDDDENYLQEIPQDPDQDDIVAPKRKKPDQSSDSQLHSADIYDDILIVDKLPQSKPKLLQMLSVVKGKIRSYKSEFLTEQKANKSKISYVGENSVPICADVTKFDWELLMKRQVEAGGRAFDVVMMDPPWRLATSQPSRGVAIQYNSLSDEAIEQIPIGKLQTEGFLFIWVINAKFQLSVNLMRGWGYDMVDVINWVKKSVNGKTAKGHGFYLQHAKQTCLVGKKGNPRYNSNVCSDIIFSDRRGQSQKPTQIYQYIEQLVPEGYYLEIFGRRNNLRQNWVTIGNEI